MYLEEFINYIRSEKRYSQHTIISYKVDLNQFFTFISNDYQIKEPENITFKIIRNWISHLLEIGLKAKSVNRKISSLKTYFRFMLMSDYLKVNPTLKLKSPKISKRLPVFIEKEKINNLLDMNYFDNTFVGSRDKLIIELFYFTGMRLSELLNISTSDIDFNNSQIKVLGKRSKERLIPLTYNLLEDLRSYIKRFNLNQYLFVDEKNNKLYSKKIYRLVNKYISKVSSLKKRSPHVLRHSFATHMLNNGADINAIKEILGHVNLSATQIYTHNSIKKLKNVHKQAHPKA